MPPKLRTINYSKSVISEGLDELFKYAFIANENSKKRQEALALEGRIEKRDEAKTTKANQFALDLLEAKDKSALELFDKKKEWDTQLRLDEAKIKAAEKSTEILYRESLRQFNEKQKESIDLIKILEKFGASPDKLNMTSNLEALSNDIFETTAQQAGVYHNNAQVYGTYVNELKQKRFELEEQGRVLLEEETKFAGANKMLEGPEFEEFLKYATTDIDKMYKLPSEKMVPGLGWDYSYGAKFAFAEAGSVAARETAAMAITNQMVIPSKANVSAQGTIIMSQFTLEEGGDIDDVVDHIEDNKSESFKFTDDEKKELGVLVAVMGGIKDPIQMYDKIMEYSGDEKGDYNLDRLLTKTSPVAWENFKLNHAEYRRIQDDKLESAFIADPKASFQTRIKNITAVTEMFEAYHDMNQGAENHIKISNFDLMEQTFAKNNNQPIADLGEDFDIWLKEEITPKPKAGDDSGYAESEALVDVVEAREAVATGVADRESSLKNAYFAMKGEMTGKGERNLSSNLTEYKTEHGESALFSGSIGSSRMVFNDAMLKSPENIKKIRKEVLSDIRRLAAGGWSPGEGFHEADDVKELLDLLRAFDKETSSKSQAELELEYKNALSSLAELK